MRVGYFLNKARLLAICLLLSFTLFVPVIHARGVNTTVKGQRVEVFKKAGTLFRNAYEKGDTSKLNEVFKKDSVITVITEHSICEDCKTKPISLAGSKAVISWIDSLHKSKGPPYVGTRGVAPTIICNTSNRCDFEGPILHSNIYLKGLEFKFHQNKPYIIKIYLLDGD